MKFSQRIGITPLSKNLQIDSMDKDLKNGLWNVFSMRVLDPIEHYAKQDNQILRRYALHMWHNGLKWNIETIPYSLGETKNILYGWFHSSAKWFEIYDFIEFLSKSEQDLTQIDFNNFRQSTNIVLEREFSAYRFINITLSPVTNEHEKLEIESALNNSASFTHLSGCNIHLTQALKMLSDRINPDYRNSIKESISAVESVAKIIAGIVKDELGTALSILKTKANLNAGLVSGFKSIYGWTSNSDGIRHGLMDEPNCDFDDAKYMLVSCSAFINYLISKAQKAGITLS